MKKFIITFLILIFAAINCNIAQASKISPEILHNMQTAYYDTGDTQKVLNAVLTTLYDSDYTIEDYDQDLGLIRAKKTFKAKYTSKKRIAGWSAVLLAASAYTAFSYGATAASMYSPTKRIATEMKEKTVIADVNVLIEQVDTNKTMVRFVPIERVLQNADGYSFVKAAPVKIFRMYKPDVYKEFFSQTEKNSCL